MLNLKKQASFYKIQQIITKNKLLLCCHCNNMNTNEWCLLKKQLSKLNLLKGVNTLLVKNKIANNLLQQLELISQSKSTRRKQDTVGRNTNTALSSKKISSTIFFTAPFSKSLQIETTACSAGATRLWQASQKKTKLDLAKPAWIESASSSNKQQKLELTVIPKLFQGPTFIIGCDDLDIVVPVISLLNSNKKLLIVGGILEKKTINHLDIQLLKNLDKSIFNQLLYVLQHPSRGFFSVSQKLTTQIMLLLQAKQKQTKD